MLTLLRPIIGWIFFNGLYFGGIGIALASIVRKAEWGLLLMVALIPQSNVFYRLYTFPMGKDFLEVLFCADVVGIFVNKGGLREREIKSVIKRCGGEILDGVFIGSASLLESKRTLHALVF